MSDDIDLARKVAKEVEDGNGFAITMALIAIAEQLERLNENIEYVTRVNGGIVVDINN